MLQAVKRNQMEHSGGDVVSQATCWSAPPVHRDAWFFFFFFHWGGKKKQLIKSFQLCCAYNQQIMMDMKASSLAAVNTSFWLRNQSQSVGSLSRTYSSCLWQQFKSIKDHKFFFFLNGQTAALQLWIIIEMFEPASETWIGPDSWGMRPRSSHVLTWISFDMIHLVEIFSDKKLLKKRASTHTDTDKRNKFHIK